MLVSINISASDLLDQYAISKKETEDVIDYAIKEIAAQFASKWQDTASRELKGTRDRYISNIKVIDSGRMEGAVLLDYTKDPLIAMLEDGASAFDIKEGFEKSAKKKTVTRKDGSTGWYLTIPFSAGSPGSNSSSFTTILPSQVYNVVKVKVVSPLTNTSQGLTKAELPTGYEIPKVRAAIIIPESQSFKEYQHKSSIYQGVSKRTDSVTGQNSYGSFRRVSDLSDEDSWIHPGIEAKHLMEKSLDLFEPMIERVTEMAMNNSLAYFGFE